MRIAGDGSLLVRESITFRYEVGFFSGAYRDIPLRKGESIDRVVVSENGQPYETGGCVVLGCSDRAGTYGVTRVGDTIRVVWHYDAVNTDRTYTVSYRFRGLAIAYDDVVDVNLKVWGSEWPVGLGRLRASMQLPTKLAVKNPQYRVFGHPAWVRGDTTKLPRFTLLRALRVPDHQFVELRTLIPRSSLTSTAGAQVREGNALDRILAEEKADAASYERDRERIDDAIDNIWRTILILLGLAFGPGALIVLFVWWWSGRERSVGYDREYEQAPPSELEAALVPPLLRQGGDVGSNEFTATLFDLIRRGRYKATPVTTEKKHWGGLSKENVADLELSTGDTAIEMASFEEPVADIVDSLLTSGSERLSKFRDRIDDHRTTNSKRFASFKSRVGASISRRKWFIGPGLPVLVLALIGFVLLAVILLWTAIAGWRSVSPRWTDVVLVALGICSAFNAVLMIVALSFVRLWRRRTAKAELEAERWDAFRRYLTDFPRLDEAPPATLELWERFLVYGIALGIAERVLQGAQLHMPQELATASSIYWISGSSDLGSGASALAISDLTAGFGRALAPPSSSSSSGGGGGFSGGGGAW